MAVNFEALTPSDCSNCAVLQGAILRRRGLIAQCNRIIEAEFAAGISQIDWAMNKTEEVEAQVTLELSRFVAKCTVANPVDPKTGCRVPTSDWQDIV